MGRSGCSAVRWSSMSWSAQLSCAKLGGEAILQDRLECHEVIAKYPSTLRGDVTVEVPPLQGRGMDDPRREGNCIALSYMGVDVGSGGGLGQRGWGWGWKRC